MKPFSVIGMLCAAVLFSSAAWGQSRLKLDDMPARIQKQLWDLLQSCQLAGGVPQNPMKAVELANLDDDNVPDVILDEARFPCTGVEERALCAEAGCSTYVMLSDKGRWRAALDIIGSYCLDRSIEPAKFYTMQKQFLVNGSSYIINIPYRFTRGMAFQEKRADCPQPLKP
jgi:hypothetical protein